MIQLVASQTNQPLRWRMQRRLGSCHLGAVAAEAVHKVFGRADVVVQDVAISAASAQQVAAPRERSHPLSVAPQHSHAVAHQHGQQASLSFHQPCQACFCSRDCVPQTSFDSHTQKVLLLISCASLWHCIYTLMKAERVPCMAGSKVSEI